LISQFNRRAHAEATKSVVIKNRANQIKPNYLAKRAIDDNNKVKRDYEALRRSLAEDEQVPKQIIRKLRIPATDTL